MLLLCVESDKLPFATQVKTAISTLTRVFFLINIAYTANNILYNLYAKMFISSTRNCDHMMKTLYRSIIVASTQVNMTVITTETVKQNVP